MRFKSFNIIVFCCKQQQNLFRSHSDFLPLGVNLFSAYHHKSQRYLLLCVAHENTHHQHGSIYKQLRKCGCRQASWEFFPCVHVVSMLCLDVESW